MFACTVCDHEVGETQFEDVLALVLKFEGNEFIGEIAAREYISDLWYNAQAKGTSSIHCFKPC